MFRTTCALLRFTLPLGLTACVAGPAAEQGDPVPAASEPAVLVDAETLQESRVLVDLRQAARFVFGAPADELPLDRVDLIAPDSSTAMLDG